MGRVARECWWCRQAGGHFCPGTVWLEGEGGWLCLDCSNEMPCVEARVGGKGREAGASARATLNVYGELEFESAPALVIVRTPEELGVPRVVMDVPRPAPKARVEQPVAKNEERKREVMGSVKSARGRTTREIPEAVREAVLAANSAESGQAIARRLGISGATVYRLRSAASERQPDGRKRGRPKMRRVGSSAEEDAPREPVYTSAPVVHEVTPPVHISAPVMHEEVPEESFTATAAEFRDRVWEDSVDSTLAAEMATPGRELVTVELNLAQVVAMVERMSERDQKLFMHGGVSAVVGVRG